MAFEIGCTLPISAELVCFSNAGPLRHSQPTASESQAATLTTPWISPGVCRGVAVLVTLVAPHI